MKTYLKLIILIHFALISFSLQAQQFAPLGAQWIYTVEYCFQTPTFCGYYYLNVEKDTIINNKTCQKINKTYTQITPTRIDTTFFVYGEDRRVFLFENQNSSFRLLYDFNLNTGDTLVVAQQGSTPPFYRSPGEMGIPNFIVQVDSTAIYETNGMQLKVQNTSPISNENGNLISFLEFSNRTIERIGNTDNFFGHPVNRVLAGFYGYLVCYSENGQVLYGSPDCISTGINYIDGGAQFHLFPNPAHQTFQIQWTDNKNPEFQISITDAIGKQVFFESNNQTNNTAEYNISHLSNGVYFVQLSSNGQILGYKKLIKQ